MRSSHHSTFNICQRLSLAPEQKLKCTTAGYFILGTAVIYGAILFGKEWDSSFSLSSEEMLAFMNQSLKFTLPSSLFGGLLSGMYGYRAAKNAYTSSIPLDDDLLINIPSYRMNNVVQDDDHSESNYQSLKGSPPAHETPPPFNNTESGSSPFSYIENEIIIDPPHR